MKHDDQDKPDDGRHDHDELADDGAGEVDDVERQPDSRFDPDPEPAIPGPFKVRKVSAESLINGDWLNAQNGAGWMLDLVMAYEEGADIFTVRMVRGAVAIDPQHQLEMQEATERAMRRAAPRIVAPGTDARKWVGPRR